MKQTLTIYRRDKDYGNASCLVTLLIFTFIIMMVAAYFLPDLAMLKAFLYLTVGLIVFLVLLKVTEFQANKGEKVMVLS